VNEITAHFDLAYMIESLAPTDASAAMSTKEAGRIHGRYMKV
jgi:hypothetical protein